MDFSDTPNRMNGPNGKPRFAYVTFVMLNDNYLPGALVAGSSLRKQSTQAELVCLVTDGVSPPARLALESLFDHVPKVEPIFVPHKRRQQRQDRPYFFTRIQSLRLGTDGDLGYGFEKIAVIDADLLPLRYCDHLFCLPAPAGVLNETKSHLIQSNEGGKYEVTDEMLETGKWKWHRKYDSICPHGFSVPSEITDRVARDPANMGMNGALFVLKPSSGEYEKILCDVQQSGNSTARWRCLRLAGHAIPYNALVGKVDKYRCPFQRHEWLPTSFITFRDSFRRFQTLVYTSN